MATPTFVSRVFNLEFQPLNFFQGNFHIISRVFNGNFNGKRCIVLGSANASSLAAPGLRLMLSLGVYGV